MSKTGNASKMMAGKTVVEAVNASNPNSDASKIRFLFALIGAVFFLGNDAVKIVFRRDFGVDKIALIRFVVLSIVLFMFGLSCKGFYDDHTFDNLSDYAFSYSENSFIPTAIFYVVLSFYILYKGIRHYSNSQKEYIDADDEGEPGILSFLNQNYGWSEEVIQYFAEPFYVLFIGGIFFFYNPIGAIPFGICAISVWGFQLIKLLFSISPNVSKQQPQNEYSEVD